MGAVYLFYSDKGNHLKHNILQFYIVIIFFCYGESLFGQESKTRIERVKKWTKRALLKNLNFFPYIEYKPSVTPSENGKALLKDLNILEKITDDHVQFENDVNEELKKERGKRIDEVYDIIRRRRRISRKRKDPIEEKVSDINYIRNLTQRYESWSPKWDKKVDLTKEDLTIDEIDLVQYELRRISKKHRHYIYKQKI
tara:strand:- start:425 stop:1018 length:594 start_codon:yes stop_codon:yes gene_type:complete